MSREEYQVAASMIAEKKGINKVDLDICCWRNIGANVLTVFKTLNTIFSNEDDGCFLRTPSTNAFRSRSLMVCVEKFPMRMGQISPYKEWRPFREGRW
jgi:hypothetical protein